jgi:uncharacterized protein YyaL (SSP411 family)
MIAALAKAGRALGNPAYTTAAARAAEFVLSRMRTPDGGLYHRFRDGEAAIPGLSADFAMVALGLIELYLSLHETRWLDDAASLTGYLADHFRDEAGGFFLNPEGESDLPARQKDLYDGALPSANSVAFMDLLILARITGDGSSEQEAAKIARAFSRTVRRSPSSYGFFLCGLDYAIGPSHEVLISGDPSLPEVRAMLDELERAYIPRAVVLLRDRLPGAEHPGNRDAGPGTAYICSGRSCRTGTRSAGEVLDMVGARRAGKPEKR